MDGKNKTMLEVDKNHLINDKIACKFRKFQKDIKKVINLS